MMGDTIGDELEALRRERPKHADLTDTLVDLIESILSADSALSVPVAVEEYMVALNTHIDRRVGVYVRGAEIVG